MKSRAGLPSDGESLLATLPHLSILAGAILILLYPYNLLHLIPLAGVPFLLWLMVPFPFVQQHAKGALVFAILWFAVIPFCFYLGIWYLLGEFYGERYAQGFHNQFLDGVHPFVLMVEVTRFIRARPEVLSTSISDFVSLMILFWYLMISILVPLTSSLVGIYQASRKKTSIYQWTQKIW
jgi:hypothetical protein